MAENASDSRDSGGWRTTVKALKHRPVLAMLLLGYAAGVPLMVVLATSGFWLREIGVSRTAIGFLVWASMPWALKFAWSPLVDGLKLPLLTRVFGQRRSYMLLCQFGIIGGIGGIALLDPAAAIDAGGNATSTAAREAGLTALNAGVLPLIGGLMNVGASPPDGSVLWIIAFLLAWTAFCSATQDIALDAYRIEAAPDEFQGAMAATYQYGYRIAIIVAGAGALFIADGYDWATAYYVLAASMSIGVITTLLVREPLSDQERRALRDSTLGSDDARLNLKGEGVAKAIALWVFIYVVKPIAEFFQRNGWMALVILALISTFRLSDLTLGAMANPFYVDIGFTKSEVASIAKFFGVIMTIVGVTIGGLMVSVIGIMRMLLVSAFLLTVTNLLFAIMAVVGSEIWMLMITISADNIAAGISGTVFIAYLSSLTNRTFTATQYALFTSLMSLFGKFVAGWSGVVVDATDYVFFFIYASTLGIPSILLILFVMFRGKEGMPGYGMKPKPEVALV